MAEHLRLHLRWISKELYERIQKAAKLRGMTQARFVATVMQRHLDGGGVAQPIGMCSVCKRRAVAAGKDTPVKAKSEAEVKNEAQPGEPAAPTERCRHNLSRHPGCLSLDGMHAHGAFWPRAECEDEVCRSHERGWRLKELHQAKAKEAAS